MDEHCKQGCPLEAELTPEEVCPPAETPPAPAEAADREALAARAAALRAEKARFLREDLARFVERWPGVDPGRLERSPQFRRFAGDRMYRQPLCQLYADFAALVMDAGQAAQARWERRWARSTGGGAGGGAEPLTPEQRRCLDQWNRENPGLEMTAREFLSM